MTTTPGADSAEAQARSPRYWLVPLALTILLTLWLSAQPPRFSKDSQYYVQSALLWQNGNDSYAGSLIGARHLTVGYYRAFLVLLGSSLDSLSIALALLFFAWCVCTLLVCKEMLGRTRLTAGVATLVIVMTAGLELWRFPATEAPQTVIMSLFLVLWLRGWNSPHPLATFVLAGCVAGLGEAIRPGCLLLVLAAIFAVAIRRGVEPREKGLLGLMLLAGCALGMGGSRILRSAWIPTPPPPAFVRAFLAFQVLEEYGNTANGPVSRRAGLEMGLPEGARLPFRETLKHAFRTQGPSAADRLVTSAGLEAIRKHPSEMTLLTAKNFAKYLIGPPRFKWERGSPADRHRAVGTQLSLLDDIREDQTGFQGNDPHTSTAPLTERRLPIIERLQAALPFGAPSLAFGSLVLTLWLITLLTRRGRSASLLGLQLPFVLHFAAVLFAAAFSQGYLIRYSGPSSTLALLMFAINVAVIRGGPPAVKEESLERDRA